MTKLVQTVARRLDKLSPVQRKIVYGVGVLLLFACVFWFMFQMISLIAGDEDNEEKAPEPPPKPQMVEVVAAAADIPARATLTEDMLKIIELPPDVVPLEAITKRDEAVGRLVRVPIMQGDVLTNKKILTDMKMAGFTGQIPSDRRAMSVSITNVTGIAGFAKAGDYVDVMMISDKDKRQITGEIILQNVLLLAINGNPQAVNQRPQKEEDKKDNKDGKEGEEKKPQEDAPDNSASKEAMATATLAVTPEEALELAVAAKEGTLYLMLRPFRPDETIIFNTDFARLLPDNSEKKPEPQVTAPQITNPLPQAQPAQKPKDERKYFDYDEDEVEIIRGTESNKPPRANDEGE